MARPTPIAVGGVVVLVAAAITVRSAVAFGCGLADSGPAPDICGHGGRTTLLALACPVPAIVALILVRRQRLSSVWLALAWLLGAGALVALWTVWLPVNG